MITYRIVQYRCMCEYKYTGVNNRPKRCPECNRPQLSVVFWCAGCGEKQKVIPLSGRKERCYECSMHKTRGTINLAFQKKYNKKHGISELTSETLEEKEERHFNELFEKIRVKYAPPVVEGVNEAIF